MRSGGRGRNMRRMGRTLDRFNARNMKYWMDTMKRMRQPKPHPHQTDDLCDRIWPYKFRWHLTGRNSKCQIFSREPHLLPTDIPGRHSLAVSSSFSAPLRPDQCFPGPPPGAITALEKSLDRGDSSLGSLGRNQRGLITKAAHEQGKPSREHRQGVMGIFSPS